MFRQNSGWSLRRLNEFQATGLAFAVGGIVTLVLLTLLVKYRDTPLPLYLLGGTLALVLAIIIVAYPEIGTYVLVVTVFTNLSDVLKELGFPSINKPLVVLIAISILVSFVVHKNLGRHTLIRPSATEWFMLAYGATWMLSVLFAAEQDRALSKFSDFVKDYVILLCVVYSLKSLTTWKQALWLILISTAILAFLGGYQALTGNFSQTFLGFSIVNTQDADLKGRFAGPIGDPNFYGQVLAAVLPLAVYQAMDEKKPLIRIIAAGFGLIIAFAIFNTYSRGAFLAMVVVLFLIALERRVKFSYLVVIGLSTFLLMSVLPAGYTERVRSILALNPTDERSIHTDSSFRGRSSEMLAGLLMFAEHPFLGVGAGNAMYHYQEYASRIGLEDRTAERKTHSIYIEIAAETGLAGLITFGGLFSTLYWGLAQARRKLRRIGEKQIADWVMALQMGITSYLITSMFLHGDYIRYLWLLVALGVSVMHIVKRLPEGDDMTLSQKGMPA